MPPASEYIERSTAIGCVDSMIAPNDALISSGTSLLGPAIDTFRRVARLRGTVKFSIDPARLREDRR